VVSGSGLLWHGITLGGIWSLRSALPLSAYAGKDLNNDGQLTDYVPGTTKVVNGIQDLNIINAWRATKGLAPIPLSQIQSNRYNQLDLRVSQDFTLHERFKIQLIGQLFNVFGTTNYFCDPQSPWQRGSNENTNGLLRQYFPKRTDLSVYSQEELDAVALRLNQRPRKTLGFKTPADKLQASVALTH
jgi:hypothetical protein